MNTEQMDSLTELVSRVQAGDPAAFDAVMERFQDLVYGLAITRVRRREDAEDVCQEVFLEAYQHMGSLREPHYLPTWLGRLVVKHADRIQRRPRSPAIDPALADALPTAATAPASATEAEDEPPLALLTAALGRMPSGQRLVLVLHYLCRRPVAAIAETLDLSEAAVKKRLFDGRKRLEERMRQAARAGARADAVPGRRPCTHHPLLPGGAPRRARGGGDAVARRRAAGARPRAVDGGPGRARTPARRQRPDRAHPRGPEWRPRDDRPAARARRAHRRRLLVREW